MRSRIILVLAGAVAATSTAAFADEPPKQQPAAPPPSVTTVTGAEIVTQAEPNPALSPAMTTSAPAHDTVELHQTIWPNRAVLITGSMFLLGSYATTAAVAATRNLDKSLYIPVAGPWLHVARAPARERGIDKALVVGSGVMQGAGVLMTAASFVIPEKIPAAVIEAGDVKIHVRPTVGLTSAGIGAFGTF